MKNTESTELFDNFEKKIKKFKKQPTKYHFRIEDRIIRQAYNSAQSFFIYLLIALFINGIGYIYFNISQSKVDSTALLAIFSLFITIATRSYSVNYFLFHTIGNLFKNYLLDQLANKIGFLHRFMALSTLFWAIVHFKLVEISTSMNNIFFIILTFLTIIILTALAIFRRKHHNIFENIHRYLGYITILLLIYYYFKINTILGLNIIEIISKPHFFLLVFIVAMLITPWIGVKKIYPKLIHVNENVIGIQLRGEPSFGTYSKITLANGQFHPFGDSMYDFDDMRNRTLYITPAGDRTTKIINEANKDNFLLKECTIKRDRFCGFMYQHSRYNNILIIVTGGGIAPIIPCLVLNKHTKMNLLWIGKSQTDVFGKKLIKNLKKKIENQDIGLHILDTTDEDLKRFTNKNYVALAMKAYKHYNPEAVFIMSNQNLTIDMIHAFNEKGVRTYGATFDS